MPRGVALWGLGRAEEPEWTVFLTVAVALFLGWLTQAWALGRTDNVAVDGMTLAYPSAWLRMREEGASFAAADLAGKGAFAPRVSLWEMASHDLVPAGLAADTGPTLVELAAVWGLKLSERLSAYRPLKSERTSVQGREAISISYAYVSDGAQGGTRTVPRVMRAADTLVLGGDRLFVLSFAAESGAFDDMAGQHERLLASWRLP
ncbi:MAG: hypothetical protein HYY05_03010 [Chloroflexi bacterium]|nr:hypothetical protein [Chloroflexota bacterium]